LKNKHPENTFIVDENALFYIVHHRTAMAVKEEIGSEEKKCKYRLLCHNASSREK
jgi:hypothetical protein